MDTLSNIEVLLYSIGSMFSFLVLLIARDADARRIR